MSSTVVMPTSGQAKKGIKIDKFVDENNHRQKEETRSQKITPSEEDIAFYMKQGQDRGERVGGGYTGY